MGREKLAGSLLTFVPLLFKKLMKSIPDYGISKQQLGLLFHISNEDRRPMSYYSEKMMIPKSNLTVLSDKLIEEEFVERVFDPNDRRVVNLQITAKGKDYLCEYKNKIIQEMVKKLDSLNDSDIQRLNELIDEIRLILDKVDQ